MMRSFVGAASAMVVVFFAGSVCADDLRVGGSTTSLPIISSCAAQFMEKYPIWNEADDSLPKETTVIYVTGGGSGFGVKGLMNGTIDVGMVARDLKDSEVKDLGGPLMKPFARDAMAIATSSTNPLTGIRRDLTTAELAGIFSGRLQQQSDLDSRLPKKPFVLLTRDAAGGVTEIFQQRVLKGERLAASRLQFTSTAGLIKKLGSSDSTIAFLSVGAISHDGNVQDYSVDGIAPTEENIISEKYSLSRPLLLIAKSVPPRRAQLFIDFVLSDCQATVKELGFVPVNAVP